jgi:filamentous hemagglutinin family protein
MSNSIKHRGLTVGVLFAAIANILWPAPAGAQNLPSGMISTVGPAPTVGTSGTTMTVTLGGPRAIINWNTFDVAAGYTFDVVGANTSDLLVNRVLGGSPTDIHGLVQANANIWILNPAGTFIGNTGRFDVGSLLLSTSDITDADLLDGNLGFNLSGSSSSGITVAQGSQLRANSGGIALLADAMNANASFSSTGSNMLLGARDVTVTFDANLGAITTYTVNTGASQVNSVLVGTGAAFTGAQNILMAAGMASGQGNVLLSNPGGASDIVFNAGSVELVSRDANVVAQGVFTTPGDLAVTAGNMFQGNGGPTVGGNYSVTAQDFSGGVFNPVFVGTNNSLSITDTAGTLTIGNISAPGDINVAVAAGSLSTNGTFGAPTSTNGNISLSAANDIYLGGDLLTLAPGSSISLSAAGSISQTAGRITTGTLNASAGFNITLGGLNDWKAASFTNAGNSSIIANSFSSWSLTGAQSHGSLQLSGLNIVLAGDAVATGDIEFTDPVSVEGDRLIQSTGGNVLLDSSLDGSVFPSNLTIDAGGESFVNGNVGATTALTSLTVNGTSTFSGASLATTGAIDLDDATITGVGGEFAASAGGAFSASSLSAPNSSVRVDANGIQVGSISAGDNTGFVRNVELNAGTGGVQLGSGYAGEFAITGDGNLVVPGVLEALDLTGAMGGSATLSGDNRISALGAFSANGLALRDINSLVINGAVDAGAGDARIEVVGDTLQIDAGGAVQGNDIALSSTGFFNFSGAGALAAMGHWVVYQQNPFSANYDGLDSGNTAIWGQTLATLDPSLVGGNHYVFAFTPTLAFTTTDTSKTYGTDLGSSAGSFVGITGYQPGVAGAYLADTAASVFSGAPLVTSSGFAERASVAGGPYAIDIANGSLVALNGYQFAFSGTGNVTGTPKTLTGTATTTTKTYDGTTSGSGSILLSGVVIGDTVGASGTFTFVDRNAGLGKTVNLSGATLSGADAGNYTISVPATTVGDILQKAITGTGTVDAKSYDGTTDGNGTITLSGVVAGDDLGADGTFTFADRNAGTDKTVTLTGVTLTGVDAGNYTLTVPASLLGDILRKAITGTVTVGTKTYDGNANGSGLVTLADVVAGDDVSGSATFTFSDRNAGTGKTVTVSGASLSGAEAGNYTVTIPASALGDILQKAITGTATAATKTYDGTANGSGTVALGGVVAGDDVDGSATFTFSDRNAGTGKTVTVSGGTLTGVDAANYTLTLPASVLGDILQKAITGTATASTKTYDGTTAGSGTVALSGVVAGDNVNGSATFTFSDKNAGTSKTVTLSGATLSGTDAGNYTLTLPASVLGDILQKAITGTATASTKTYDGTAAGSGTVALGGVVAGDDVAGSGTFTFSDKNAGTSKTVTVSGAALSGADAGNYTVTLPASVLGDILQKAITGTAVANTKTYDGSAAGSGTVGLSGVVAGDDVAGSATFTFSDKNAGISKTVTVSGATLSGTDAGNYTVTLPASVLGDILQKAITGTATASAKTYDGTTAGSGTVALSGVVAGDNVNGSATFTFSDKNAGTSKTVTVSGATLSGTDAGNYTVTLPASVLGDILQKAITGTAVANTKTYDGSTAGSGTVGLSDVVAGDDVAGSATFTFSDKNAGTSKTVTVSGATLSGTDAGNYTVTLPASALGDILQKAITGTATASTKTYDGTTAGSGTVALGGVVAGDNVNGSATFTFSDKNAGTSKTVTLSGATLSGTDAGNYAVTLPASVLGDILQKAITGTATAATKTYDGTSAGSGTVALGGVVAGDNVNGSATFTFSDKNAGTSKTVTVSGATLSGTDAGNYTVTLPASVFGDILQKAITGTATASNKTYDGNTAGSGTVGLSGVVAGDDVNGSATFTFSDKNAGTSKTVTVSGATLSGTDAGNYTVTLPATVLGDILQKAITGTATVDTRTYDGGIDASGTIGVSGVVAGDTVGAGGTFEFADKNAGSGKVVAVSGVTLSGADAGNYTISVPASAIGEILRKSITGTATVADKTYDGTRSGTGSIALDGVIAGDSIAAGGTYTFSDANAGTGKTVAVGGVALSGADAGNYTVVVPGSSVADILRRAITVTANPATKPEGAADPALAYGITQGSLVADDALSGSLDRVAGEAPGQYSIGQGTLDASANYELTFVGSTLTITAVDTGPTDPTDGLVVQDNIGSVVRFLLGVRAASDEDAGALQIADDRPSCKPGASSAGCQAARHD